MASARKHGLGKGLDALFGEIEGSVPLHSDESHDDNRDGIIYIDINDIKPNGMQPRKSFSDETLERLAASIESHGVIQPVMVKKSGSAFELVAGERRWRAARRAGLSEIPAIVREVSPEENALFAIIENVQREDLNPIEEAEAFRKIIDSYKITQESLSKSIGKSRPYIANTMRLLKLPTNVRDMLQSGELSLGHANAIGGLKDEKALEAAASQIAREGLSVREAERLASKISDGGEKKAKKPAKSGKSVEIKAIEDELTSMVGSKVTVESNGQSGYIALHFYGREELDGLIEDLSKIGKK